MFDLARIERCGLVARIDYHESMGSTSDRAVELGGRDEAELPLLVLAERQTAGRGRGTNRWWSDDGALTFSVVLEARRERLPPSRWPQVALVAGVAVCEALQRIAPRAKLQVKWPNDVYFGDGYLDGGKICGILCESIPGWRDRLVVGVGVNVNNRIQGSGFRVREAGDRGQGIGDRGQETGDRGRAIRAASLIEHDGVQRDLTDVLLGVLDELDRRWSELIESRFDEAAAVYRQRCLLTGKTVTIEQAGKAKIVGVCRGIDEQGQLRVQTERGEEAVASGSVASWDG
jgi:BirA family biotin operon repressor/biotin-[acetyl-CoA-carboxylase] ligase